MASLTLALLACGSGKKSTVDSDAGVAALKRARFELVSVIDVPMVARAEMLAARAEIEADGFSISDDGSEISWEVIPAAGWLVRFGEQVAVTDGLGEVVIEIPAGVQVGTLTHPQEIDKPLFEIRSEQLVADGQSPMPIELTMTFTGPCGMNDDPAFPDPAACAMSTLRKTADAPHQHAHAHGHEQAAKPDLVYSQTDPAMARMDGALGSYPMANQHCCRDFDGGNWDPTTWYGTIRNYLGSTCDQLVSNGCCSGELGSLTASALSSVGLLTPISCKKNHKGRYCQEVARGDVAFQAPAGTASAYLTGAASLVVQPVHLGETIEVTVHNNGCFGETLIPKVLDEIKGELSGGNFTAGIVGILKHYSNPNTYVPDQRVQYVVPACKDSVAANAVDLYFVQTDVKTLDLRFELQTDTLFQFDGGGTIFDMTSGGALGFWVGEFEEPSETNDFIGCPGQHLHGLHPCTGAADPAPKGCGHGRVAPWGG